MTIDITVRCDTNYTTKGFGGHCLDDENCAMPYIYCLSGNFYQTYGLLPPFSRNPGHRKREIRQVNRNRIVAIDPHLHGNYLSADGEFQRGTQGVRLFHGSWTTWSSSRQLEDR